MKVSIIEYPGSTNLAETKRVFADTYGLETKVVWHDAESLGKPDLVVLPGGFSYADCLRPGALAALSPASGMVKRFASKGGKVLGIGNGFQILCEVGVLPGCLLVNEAGGFIGDLVDLAVSSSESSLTDGFESQEKLKIPLACYYGRYWADRRELSELEESSRVVCRYVDRYGDFDEENTFNSSSNGIAGIVSRDGNVLGLMPHPERALDSIHSSQDGKVVFDSVLSSFGIN